MCPLSAEVDVEKPLSAPRPGVRVLRSCPARSAARRSRRRSRRRRRPTAARAAGCRADGTGRRRRSTPARSRRRSRSRSGRTCRADRPCRRRSAAPPRRAAGRPGRPPRTRAPGRSPSFTVVLVCVTELTVSVPGVRLRHRVDEAAGHHGVIARREVRRDDGLLRVASRRSSRSRASRTGRPRRRSCSRR